MARWRHLALAAIVLVVVPVPAVADQWDASTTTRIDAGRTGFAGGASLGRPPLVEQWRADVPSGSTVVAADGLIFASGQTSGRDDGALTAYDGADGSVRWRRPLSGDGRIALGDGTLVLHTLQGQVTAFNAADGERLWTTRIAASQRLDSSPVISGGLAYVAAGAALHALDLGDGTLRWQKGLVIDDEVAVAGGQVLDGQACGGEGMDPRTGQRLWHRQSLCQLDYHRLHPAGDGGRLITGTTGILDASGGALLDRFPLGVEKLLPASLAGDLLITHADDGMRARSLSGRAERWMVSTAGGFTGAPLVVDAVVYQGTGRGDVQARDVETGALLWSTHVAWSSSSPGVSSITAADGRLLVVASGKLVAFGATSSSPAAGLRIISGPSGPTRSTQAAMTFTSPGGLGQTCALDGGAPVRCAGTVAYTSLADGPHVETVRSVAADGTVLGVAARGFSVDTTGPQTYFEHDHRSGIYNSSSFETATETEEERVGECRLDDQLWQVCGLVIFNDVPDGEHRLQARGQDALGNVGPVTSKTVLVDTVRPEITVVSGPPPRTRDTDAQISFETSPDVPPESVLCIDERTNSRYSPCESPLRLTDRAEGQQQVLIYGQDRAGHLSREVSVEWEVDRTAPTTRITSGPDARTLETRPAFTVADDGVAEGDVHECRVDTGAWTGCDPAMTPWRTELLGGGGHVVSIRAIDDVGNVEPTPPEHRFVVDAPPPAADASDPAATQRPAAAPTIEQGSTRTERQVTEPGGAVSPVPARPRSGLRTFATTLARRLARSRHLRRLSARHDGGPGTLVVRVIAAGRLIARWRGTVTASPRGVELRLSRNDRRRLAKARRIVVEARLTTPEGAMTVVRRRAR